MTTTVIIDKKKSGRTAYVASKWPDETLERLDRARTKTYLSRSSFVLKIITEYLDGLEGEEQQQKDKGRAPTQPSRSAKANHSTPIYSDTLRPLVEIGKGGND